MSEFSWVTLATNDSYSLGALVLAHSLKRVGTRYQLVVMVTPGVTQTMREKLANVFDLVFEVNILDSKDERNLLLLQRPELGITFTKLHCWRLTQYKKCVFLDADTLVLQNCDELFERDEFSAAPDVGWPDCFNSGVFVYVPSNDTFNSLLKFALDRGSFDGGDQGLLNLYFSDWAHKDISKHLPFIYNMCSTACYSYLPAFKQFGENVKIVHFIGNSKPWLQYFNSETLQVTPSPGFNHLQMIFDHWWSLFCAHVHSNLAPSMARINAHIASSCTSSSHTLTYCLNESKCEDSLCTEQSNAEINIPIWDPWDHYNPINDSIENRTTDNNINQTSNATFVHNFPEYNNDNSSNSNTMQTDYKGSETNSCKYEIVNISSNTVISQSHNSETIHNPHKTHNFHNNENTQNIYNYHTYIPPSPSSSETHYDSNTTHSSQNQSSENNYHKPIHKESQIIITETRNEISNLQNACANCQTVTSTANCETKSPTEQLGKTIAQDGNTEIPGTEENGGLAGAFAQMTLREPKSASQGALEEHLRRQGWEAGRIDYLGQDSFDNVWKKICETLSAAPVKEPSPPKQIEAPKAEAVAPAQPETVSVPTEQPVAAAPAPEAIAAAPAPEAVAAAPAPEAIAAAPAPEAVAAAPAPEAIAAAPAPESVAAAPAPVTPIPASEAVAPTPAPETAASAPVAEAVAVTPAPEAATLAATPAPEAATPAATPAPESTTPAPEAVAATPVPEAAAPEAVAATPAPEAVAAAPVPEAVAAPPTPEAAVPAPVSEPIVAAAPETVAAPASEPSAPAPASEPAAPAPAAEPAAPAPVSEPTAPIVPITETPAAAPAPEATPVVAPAAAAPVSEAASTPASTPAAPTEAIVSPVTKEAAPTPAAEATKPAEKKVEEKPSEPKVEKTTEVSKESVAVTEVKEKPATEAPQAAAAAPPAITETPATPQTPDSSKGEIKVEKKAAEGKSTETPVPPPRKSGKNGGATAKKSTKKK